jgi:hypothetical protein
MSEEKNFPTMIIPAGTEIGVNDRGQLSIRTPGNLVIQNSGSYSLIQSSKGSVRIDPDVKVEAVSVLAADSCFIAGELTAWKVKAQKITLEKGAQAYIMLQQSEHLELDRSARLVGNFASDKELYLLLGRFSRELRQLPQGLSPGREAEEEAFLPAELREGEPFVAPDGEGEPAPADRQEREETLSLVRVIFERELGRAELLAYKLRRDPRLAQAVTGQGWQLIKFRHLRRLIAEGLDRQLFETVLGLDPIVPGTGVQIPLTLGGRK